MIKKCKDCNKILNDYRSIRCGSCSKKGKNHHFWGKHFTIEHKQNQSQGHAKRNIPRHLCIDCGKEVFDKHINRCRQCFNKIINRDKIGISFSKEHKRKIGIGNRGKKRTDKQNSKRSLAMGGTGIPYENAKYPKKFHLIKEQIRERDNHKCQICGEKQGKRKLDVHHIDYDKENLDLNNLITLCRSCHTKTLFNKDYQHAYCKYLMEEICQL